MSSSSCEPASTPCSACGAHPPARPASAPRHDRRGLRLSASPASHACVGPGAGRPLPMIARCACGGSRVGPAAGGAKTQGGLMSQVRKPLSEEERAERRRADREFARKAVEQLRSSEGWQAWLATRGAFTATASPTSY
jgi:hypothetical protein